MNQDVDSFIDSTNRELDELASVMNERGLIRQYSASCVDRLHYVESQIGEYINDREDGESEALKRIIDIQQKVSRLLSAHRARVPLSEIVRRSSRDSNLNTDRNVVPREKADVVDAPITMDCDDCDVEPGQKLTRLLSISSELLLANSEDNCETSKGKGSSMYCWGRSDFGALFHPDTDIHQPGDPVLFPSKRKFMQISSNSYHSAAITTSGELYTCGANDEGQVVDDPFNKMVIKPRLMESINQTICSVSCGAYHTVCVTASGVAISYGGNEVGQLGHSSGQITYVPPRAVEGLAGRVVTAVACGELVTVLRTSTGELFSCGVGACAGHPEGANVYKATKIGALASHSVHMIVASSHHVFALTATAELYSWGSNLNGQLGVGADASGAIVHAEGCLTPQSVSLNDLSGRVVGVTVGYAHSLLWTDTGALFGCGSNKYGQLGVQSSLRASSFVPLQLPDTCNYCIQAACGHNHSLMLCRRTTATTGLEMMLNGDPQSTVNNVVLCFGANSFGQCGGSYNDSTSSPCLQRHAIEIDSLSGRGILYVAAGGDQSFAIGAVGGEDNILTRQFSIASSKLPQPLTCDMLLDKVKATPPSELISEISTCILPIFCSSTLLGGSFIKFGKPPLHLDIEGLEEVYKSVVTLGGANAVPRLLAGLHSIVKDIKQMKMETSPEFLRPIMIIWQCPLNSITAKTYDIMRAVAVYVNQCSHVHMRYLFTQILQQYPAHIFASRLLTPLQEHCSQLIKTNASSLEIAVFCNAIGWLYLFDISLQTPLVSLDKFYNTAIADLSDQTLLSDYVQWRQQRSSSTLSTASQPPFSLFNYPFLLSVETKRRVLLGDSALQQQLAQQHAFHVGARTVGYFMPFLVLEINRSNLLQESLNLISSYSEMDLKKPLKVVFRGEEGIDEGGVRKEFFQLLTTQLFDIQYGMFVEMNDRRVHWFNKDCTWSSEEFVLVGTLVGLAVYNGVILDVHLPPVLYKKLLRRVVCLEDVADIDPELCKGLKHLLSYEPAEDVEMVFCRTFEITWNDFDLRRSHELIDNGADIAVTAANRQQYVDLYVTWILVQSVSTQFNDFYRGFSRVVTQQSTELFRPEELELLVAGTPHLDFNALEAKTEYIGDASWNKDHATIKSFWNVIKGLDFPAQQKFLMFATGSTKAPVGGLGNLHLKVQRMGPDSDMLPTAHTCFNVILLPEYSSEEKLKNRVLKAIYECEGFGLK